MVKARLLSIILCFILIIGLIYIFASCINEKDSEEKYDVAIMLVRRETQQIEPTEE